MSTIQEDQSQTASTPPCADEFLESYREHSKDLRTWLTAYGIGAPLILLTNEALWKKLSSAGCTRAVAFLFLIGVALQVALSALNKALMWALYFGERQPKWKLKRRYRAADWLSEQFWIDFTFDLISITALSVATYVVAVTVL